MFSDQDPLHRRNWMPDPPAGALKPDQIHAVLPPRPEKPASSQYSDSAAIVVDAVADFSKIRTAPETKPLRILSMGCGGGEELRRLSHQEGAHQLYGFDIGTSSLWSSCPGVRFCTGDLNSWPWRRAPKLLQIASDPTQEWRGPFDVVTLLGSVQYAKSWDSLREKIVAELSPHGLVILSVSTESHIDWTYKKEWPINAAGDFKVSWRGMDGPEPADGIIINVASRYRNGWPADFRPFGGFDGLITNGGNTEMVIIGRFPT